jgi:hypothetical protein
MSEKSESTNNRESAPKPVLPEGTESIEAIHEPTKLTEASRVLTRLVGIVVPGSVADLATIDTLHDGDRVILDRNRALNPVPLEQKLAFDESFKNQYKQLMSLGLYKDGTPLPSALDFSVDPNTGKYGFKGLYRPWSNSAFDGKAGDILALGRIKKIVEKMDDNDPKKIEAESLLDYLEIEISTAKKFKAKQPEDFEGLFDEPDQESLQIFSDTLAIVSDEQIELVAAIKTKDEAERSETRSFLKGIAGKMHPIMESLRKNTKIILDVRNRSRDRYPEYWQNCDKLERIINAIGAINGDTVRR